MTITRRDALALISSAPLAAHAALQIPAGRERRAHCFRNFTYVLEPDGRVIVSLHEGLGFDGRHLGLGNSDPIPNNVAIELPGVRGALDVIRGGSGTFALMPDGHVLTWGINARGDLGITPRAEFEANSQLRRTPDAPTPVLEIANVGVVAGGDNHTVAATKSGVAYAWGYNIAGQLGIGGMPTLNFRTGSPAPYVVPYPVRIDGLSGVVGLAAGDAHSLALLDDGTVRSWGDNRLGQLGDGTTVNRNAPVAVTGVAGAVAVVAGSRISAALLGDGSVMTWGHGNGGLGRTYRPDAPHPTPARVPGVTGIRSVACGESHVLAITTAGAVVSWGGDLLGEVGHPRPEVPAAITGLTSVRSVSADVGRSIATRANGTIMVWGNVARYTRADGRVANSIGSPAPLVVNGLKNPL